MKLVLIFVIGIAVGGALAHFFRSKDKKESSAVGIIKEQAKDKEENKQRILKLLETQASLTNNQIEELLGISDATATRYLEELEQEGHVRQIGITGRQVHYKKI